MGQYSEVERERLLQLRAAVYQRDGAKVVVVLGGEVPVEVLQLVGDGLGTAIEQKVPGAVALADQCLLVLRERGWAGDDELAGELEVSLGRTLPTRGLYALPVDLEEVSALLESGTGERSDPGRADQLLIAIDGRGAFRRFKDTIARWPDELERWYRFSDERCRGRAREWLAASGYRAAPSTQGPNP
jgi:hypothetical protein